ncbi:MAG TPA: SDR family NAD(P)-dependent oxidoreductase [Methylocaldum sp.]|nr:SDR family NAD(P)-dependent oxidoreductase [Methylocaldum sp.]HYE35597.1 SDR family NAD(P)-dependent oxidoreductase [Methylocaldum sp.]
MIRNPHFREQVVVITGASSGIGRATALAFAHEGAITILASRSQTSLERSQKTFAALIHRSA